MIYESRNKVIVKEYGLIKSLKKPLFAASPDGVVIGSTINDLTRIGRLVEIKNPFTYDPSNTIKDEYKIQIMQQQYALGIPICDFVKTNIIAPMISKTTENLGYKPYNNVQQMLNDRLPGIANANLTADGGEKGVIINYTNNITGDLNIAIYPLESEYNLEAINKWILETKNKFIANGADPKKIVTQCWYLAHYSQQTIVYDEKLFEEYYIPRLELVWEIIKYCRTIKEKYGKDKINEFLENQLRNTLNTYQSRNNNYFKNVENHIGICELLKSCFKLDIDNYGNKAKNKLKYNKSRNKVNKDDNDTTEFNETTYDNDNKNTVKLVKTAKCGKDVKVSNKIMIIYDF
jgi:hypothetical protein